jgi:hypothetical protein
MKTFLITILNEAESSKVMNVLNDLVEQKLIEMKEPTEEAVSPSDEQVHEIIDESELGPYYTEEEAKDILKL